MLAQFRIGNYLSFKDNVIFSMVGYPPIKEHEDDNGFCNVILDPTGKNKLLKSGVLYGANGSGKSNLLTAMSFFKKFILTSSNERQATDEIKIIPFLLSSETDNQPSFFEMIFYIDEIRFRYGFEVTSKVVSSEWLFGLKNKPFAKETKLFTRNFQEIQLNSRSFKEGKSLESKTRANALFLSTVAQLNGEVSTRILTWIKSNFNIISGLEDTTSSYTVGKFLKDESFREKVIEFFRTIKIGFDDIEIVEEGELLEKTIRNVPEELSEEVEELMSALRKLNEKTKKNNDPKTKQVSITTYHKKFDESRKFSKYEGLDFYLESKGTIKIFSLLGPVIDTIEKGKILIIDELDSRLHTLLTLELIKFFHSKANSNAQLIFASHDTNLLKKEIFRRDQIWFTEKNNVGATDLYSLVDYKVNQAKVRNDASFERDYLIGKYGAIPFLGNLRKFVNDFLYEQKQEAKIK